MTTVQILSLVQSLFDSMGWTPYVAALLIIGSAITMLRRFFRDS